MWEYINIPDGIVICGIYKITSPEGKVYIGQAVDIRKRWKKYNSKSTGIFYYGIKDAAKAYNMNPSTLTDYLAGKRTKEIDLIRV